MCLGVGKPPTELFKGVWVLGGSEEPITGILHNPPIYQHQKTEIGDFKVLSNHEIL